MTEQELGVVIATAVKVAQAPLLERIAVLEATLQSVGTKSADAIEKIALAAASKEYAEALAGRIVKLETEPLVVVGPQGPSGERGEKGEKGDPGVDGKDGAPGAPGEKGIDGANGKDGRDGVDGKDGLQGLRGEKGVDGLNGHDGIDGKDGRDGQPGVPGVPGRDGERGEKGLDGKDGVDGKDGLTTLEFMKYEVSEDGLSVRFVRAANGQPLGDWVQTAWLRPYDGVWREGESYKAGATVTWAGSLWVARVDTTEKPQDGRGGTDWQLAVKSGRPGRDGKDGKDGVNGRDGRDGTDRIVQAHYGAGGGA